MTKLSRLSIYYSWAAEGSPVHSLARRLGGAALVSTMVELKKFRLN